MTKTNTTIWRALLSDEDLSLHQQWIESGFQDSEKLVVQDENLSEAIVPGINLTSSEFTDCDFRKSNFITGTLVNIHLKNCLFDDSMMNMCDFDEAIIEDCSFSKAYLQTNHFIKSKVNRGNWNDSDLHRSNWTEAQVADVCFQNVRFQGAKFVNARFINCDFREANLVAATASYAVFENCDFRYADINDFVFRNTLFYKCGFYGCKNVPTLEGDCKIIDADMSEEFDGSKIINSDTLFQNWGIEKQAISR